jgi:4-alpha-glucanotransferase
VSERPALRALAARCGIAPSYVGYDGQSRAVEDASCEALLAAMGFDATSEPRAEAALYALEAAPPEQVLPPVRVAPAGSRELQRVELQLGGQVAGWMRYRIELTLEDGAVHVGQGEVEARDALTLPMPAATELTFGYHTLRLEVEGAVAGAACTQDLIVVPGRCLSASELIGERRALGLWTHVYTLASRSNAGIGDLRDLRELVAWSAEQGIDFVGINPLHAADNDAAEVSPYYPLSRSFRNPIYLDLDAAVERAGAAEAAVRLGEADVAREAAELRALPRVHYARVWALKRRVLESVHAAFVGRHRARDTPLGRAYTAYREREGRSLTEFATFCALREQLSAAAADQRDFRVWPEPWRDARSAQVERFAAEHEQAIDFHAYLQFELEQQLASCQHTARAHGMAVGLYGDLAVGDAPFAADVWARPDLYARDARIGAPPDPYSDTGQDWGLTPMNPLALRADRYRAFRALLRRAFRHTGMLRIDHVMGLARQFWVPAGATAAQGAYVQFPQAELFGLVALESRRARALVVGEDLGVVPDGFRERMRESAMLRSQVLYFERNDRGAFTSPQHYAVQALATVSTHDLPPLAGFLAGRDLAVRRKAGNLGSDQALADALAERRRAAGELIALLRSEGLLPEHGDPQLADIADGLHRLLARGAPRLVGIALDDLTLEHDSLNTPAASLVEAPNWSRRSRQDLADLTRSEPVRAAIRRTWLSAGLHRASWPRS